MWEEEYGDLHRDVTRFNEAIDESLTESTARYTAMLQRTRDQFLAILGHDLRTPLSAIAMNATQLTHSKALHEKDARAASRILNSTRRMSRMVDDLLDFTRTRLGAGIPITRKAMNLRQVCDQMIAELAAAYPDRELRYEASGDLLGEWDSDRLSQVLGNLVANALQYGGQYGPVQVAAKDQGDDVVIAVRNEGPTLSTANPAPRSRRRS